MGIEYSLRFEAPDAEAVAAVLRRLPDAREAAPLSFDLGGDPGGRPEATVMPEPGGAYFYDNCGGGGRAMLGHVIARLAATFGAVTVEEL
jgi:hypothetical protein